MPSDVSRDRIETRAYQIWEEEGRPHGRDHAHWTRASTELAAPEPAIVAANGHATPPRKGSAKPKRAAKAR